MNTSGITLLYDYNSWAVDRILACAETLPSSHFVFVASASPGGVSLRGSLVHTLNWEIVWRERCAYGATRSRWLAEEDFSTPKALRERWQQEQEVMRAYLSTLCEKALASTVQYLRRSGEVAEATLWQLLLHLVIHGAHHRSQAASLLTEHGASPGDFDFLVFLRQRSAHC